MEGKHCSSLERLHASGERHPPGRRVHAHRWAARSRAATSTAGRTATCRASTCSATSAAAASGRWRTAAAGDHRPHGHEPQHQLVRRERVRRALRDRPQRLPLPGHRARVQRTSRPPRSSTASTGSFTRASPSVAVAAGSARRPPSRASRWRSSSCAPSTIHRPRTDYFTDDEGRSGEIARSTRCGRPASRAAAAAATLYCPTRRVTRAEMAIFLDKELNLAGTRARISSMTTTARPARARSTGSPPRASPAAAARGEYCPTSSVTRGQMAAFLRRALDYAP